MARDLNAVFPELAPLAPLRPLGAGFHSTVVETADRRVFRVGKTPAAAAGYAKEMRVLPALRGLVPAAVPEPRWYENILVAGTPPVMVGVLEFEDTALGDPARDIATLLHLGAPFVAQVLAACRAAGAPADADFLHRVRRWWEFRELSGVPED